MFKSVSRTQFVAAWDTSVPEDRFASTFMAKCSMLGAWDRCLGWWEGDQLQGAALMTLGKRQPTVANLQLIHTFAAHRRKGVGKKLMLHCLAQARVDAQYFRVSSEPEALAFYQSLGLRFWGKQKSGTSLCMFRIQPDGPDVYDIDDPVIHNAVFTKARGGVVDLYVITPTHQEKP